MTISQDLTIQQGATWGFGYDTGLDLSGASAQVAIKQSLQGETVATLSSTDGDADGSIVLLDGYASFALTAAVTADIPAGVYVYDVNLTAADETVTRLLEGRVFVLGGVT